jgi:hypothetical protein
MRFVTTSLRAVKRNIVFCISASGVLFLHLRFSWLPLDRLEGFTFPWSKGPLIDDSYIFFKISKDLADWLSGAIPSPHLTSGVQPLLVLLYTPLFQLFWNDKELPIHIALSLNALIGFLAHISLYCLLRKLVSRSIATFLATVWIWSPYVMNQTINGMETSLALLLLLIILNRYWQMSNPFQPGTRPWVVLGILLGIGFWARVDLGLLGIAIVLDQSRQAFAGGSPPFSLRSRNLLLCTLTALLVALPWIFFTALTTGDLMPTSGKGVHQITSVTFNYFDPDHPGLAYMMFVRFIKEFFLYQPLVTLSQHIAWKFFISVVCLTGLIIALRDRRFRTMLRSVWLFQLIILTAYLAFIGGFWHLNRYLYPVYTLMLFIHAASLHYVESKVQVRKWVLPLLLFIFFIPYAFTYTTQYKSYLSATKPSRYYAAAQFVKARIPEGARIGTFQSGALSYWLDNPVINLDGVINREAYAHVKEKTLGIYLEQKHIEYFVEETYLFRMWDHYLQNQLSNNYSVVAIKPGRSWYRLGIYKYKP